MIKYYNRNSQKYHIEKVAGDKYLNWVYSSPVGSGLLELFLKKKIFSSLYGKYCDTKLSSKKVSKFIKNFDIDMSTFEKQENEFSTFNEFFTRKLNLDSKKFLNDKLLISPCDGKLLAYEDINTDNIIQVKGYDYSLKELINNDEISEKYIKGACLIFRLCPTDYHRFHFIDDGICSKSTKIGGFYYSVNPVALNNVKKLFCQNKRQWSIFHSKNFGDVLYVEVGATCVGSIIDTFNPHRSIHKGDEKGYFKFGGSTVIMFFEQNKISIDSDILEQTSLGYETAVSFGENIGKKLL